MSQTPAYNPSAGPARPADSSRDLSWLPTAAIGTGLLLFAYGPNIMSLATTWSNEPNYSHGFLVIPIAAFIFWRRLTDHPYQWSPPRTSALTWILLAAILAARAVAYERSMSWTENATIIPATALVVYALGGLPLLNRAWPAIVFLVFMLPLPPTINRLVALPLQRIATSGSCFVLQLTGLWVVPSGNLITLSTPRGPAQLEVAAVCNGLSMLTTLAATVTATVLLVPMPIWKRIVVLLSALPIALISNISRIVATGWCYYLMEGELARERSHDWAGFLMMPLALVLVGLEVMLLSWLFDEVEAEAASRPIGLAATQRSK